MHGNVTPIPESFPDGIANLRLPLRLLLVEDQENDALLVLRELSRAGWDVVHERVADAASMIAALETQVWDIIISDYSMPGFGGMASLAIRCERAGNVPFILISGTAAEEIADRALEAGANECLSKKNLERLGAVVDREVRRSWLLTGGFNEYSVARADCRGLH